MLTSLFRILCCCCSNESGFNVVDERERLLQFQIPIMPWVSSDNAQTAAHISQAPSYSSAGIGLPTAHGYNSS